MGRGLAVLGGQLRVEPGLDLQVAQVGPQVIQGRPGFLGRGSGSVAAAAAPEQQEEQEGEAGHHSNDLQKNKKNKRCGSQGGIGEGRK